MKTCPLIGKKCLTHQCEWYTHLVGMNPQTGQPTDEWKCSMSWLPVMLVENANMTRQATASVDKVANETAGVKGAINAMNANFCSAAQTALEMKERAIIEKTSQAIELKTS